MVNRCCFLLAEVAGSSGERLEPAQRARLVGALILLTLAGLALVVLCWLTLRVGRRMSRREDAILERHRFTARDDWATRPLKQDNDARDG